MAMLALGRKHPAEALVREKQARRTRIDAQQTLPQTLRQRVEALEKTQRARQKGKW